MAQETQGMSCPGACLEDAAPGSAPSPLLSVWPAEPNRARMSAARLGLGARSVVPVGGLWSLARVFHGNYKNAVACWRGSLAEEKDICTNLLWGWDRFSWNPDEVSVLVVNVKDSSCRAFPVCDWEIISSPFLHVVQALLMPLTKGNEETTRLQKPFQPDMRMLFAQSTVSSG